MNINKVYKNDTRNKEIKLIQLYKNSQNTKSDEAIKAKTLLDIFRICLKGISVFTKYDHNKIVNALYFNKNNIIEAGVTKKTFEVSASESTLKRYRDKYCLVIDVIFSLSDFYELYKECLTECEAL